MPQQEALKCLPRELQAREAQALTALEAVASKQDKTYVLKPKAWQYYDNFALQVGPFKPRSRRSGIEEAALAQKD
eukprot:2858575-Amphidinium_carterae.1